MNSRQNIISGPNRGEYWNHSPGLEKPVNREEGPLPIQGNIGSLMKQEANNFTECSSGLPETSGSPNCTAQSAFVQDLYTQRDTCGENCVLSYPESYGGKDFGLTKSKVTNSHGLHAYKNERAAVEGSGPSTEYGCYEWTPRLSKTDGNSCTLNQYPAYQQVGDWAKLKQNSNIVSYNYKQ